MQVMTVIRVHSDSRPTQRILTHVGLARIAVLIFTYSKDNNWGSRKLAVNVNCGTLGLHCVSEVTTVRSAQRRARAIVRLAIETLIANLPTF